MQNQCIFVIVVFQLREGLVLRGLLQFLDVCGVCTCGFWIGLSIFDRFHPHFFELTNN